MNENIRSYSRISKGGNMSSIRHLRDKQVPGTSLHFDARVQRYQLTNDPKRVTCERCQYLMKHPKKARAK